jgi:hypothetical protein
MVACQGYGCLARSLERQDAWRAQEERTETERGAGASSPIVAPVLSAAAAPALGVFAGTPLDIIRAALEPWRRGSAT